MINFERNNNFIISSNAKLTNISNQVYRTQSSKMVQTDPDDLCKNEISILLVITDDNNQNNNKNEIRNNFNLNDIYKSSHKRKKSKYDSSQSSRTDNSIERENLDRINFFNYLCSKKDRIDLRDSYKEYESYLRKKTSKSKKLKKFTNFSNYTDSLKTQNDCKKQLINNKTKNSKSSKQKYINKSEKFNIYGPITHIPSTYSRPSLPPTFRCDKAAMNISAFYSMYDKDSKSSVISKFLYSKYEFEHNSFSDSSESDKENRKEKKEISSNKSNKLLYKNDSFEFKRSKFFNSNNINEESSDLIKVKLSHVGDRPNKNDLDDFYQYKYYDDLEDNKNYFNEQNESNYILNDTSQQSISRQNRIIFYESDSGVEDMIKYEANLPTLPDDDSVTENKVKNKRSDNVRLKYVKKKDIGNGLKNLNHTEIKNLSVIAEEDNVENTINDDLVNLTNKANLDVNTIEANKNNLNNIDDIKMESLSSAFSSSIEDLNSLNGINCEECIKNSYEQLENKSFINNNNDKEAFIKNFILECKKSNNINKIENISNKNCNNYKKYNFCGKLNTELYENESLVYI